ncbi:unnamed protein product [Sphagnum jensenii]|uniref:Uncharacterized protein n=1 Tax=Sphagnum jensenii TaxID=128206 RepID=A0ABP0VEF6_9BRYO
MREICNKENLLKSIWENEKRQGKTDTPPPPPPPLSSVTLTEDAGQSSGPNPCPKTARVNPGVVRDPYPCPNNDVYIFF